MAWSLCVLLYHLQTTAVAIAWSLLCELLCHLQTTAVAMAWSLLCMLLYIIYRLQQ